MFIQQPINKKLWLSSYSKSLIDFELEHLRNREHCNYSKQQNLLYRTYCIQNWIMSDVLTANIYVYGIVWSENSFNRGSNDFDRIISFKNVNSVNENVVIIYFNSSSLNLNDTHAIRRSDCARSNSH